MKVRTEADATAAGLAAARLVQEGATASIVERGRFSLALSGGSTPGPMFDALAEAPIDWERVDLFQVDERIVPDGDPDRNWRDVTGRLVEKVPIPQSNLYPMPVTRGSGPDIAARYQRALQARCGRPPVLDLVHLGLGDDGHTASWPPGDPIVGVSDWDVAVVVPYRGHERVTLTVPAVNRARRIVFLVAGEEKIAALTQLLDGDHSIPASHVRRDDTVTVVADQAALRAN